MILMIKNLDDKLPEHRQSTVMSKVQSLFRLSYIEFNVCRLSIAQMLTVKARAPLRRVAWHGTLDMGAIEIKLRKYKIGEGMV